MIESNLSRGVTNLLWCFD